ncbi:hypothetical protein Cch01nite_09200 [Cellulomonas chitinilytica]|uniref:Maltokinase N-terminal cap domain-containing protein n=1 Tax=Cellulomonas chitinilytica TaxID=398759 RepID=A0A919U085_9CELL|nr:hypothetical protein [Cellulomonas chitinilytica]GIG20196.1 hypothetical protein Cch01nite_09200 [Cellulomonas chitinilytica]
MALIHRATISPTKAELLGGWVPAQPWGATEVELVGAYRFDDPDGEVGIETHVLAAAGGQLLHAPLTYRGAPLAGAEPFLICTMEHSVLGRRWIYDATGDPVYADVLASVLLAGVVQAAEHVEGADAPREPTVRVTGSATGASEVPPLDGVVASSDGAATVMTCGDLRIVVRRRLDADASPADHESTLTGTWSGVEQPVLLAYVA